MTDALLSVTCIETDSCHPMRFIRLTTVWRVKLLFSRDIGMIVCVIVIVTPPKVQPDQNIP
jgi:hypothetical protein